MFVERLSLLANSRNDPIFTILTSCTSTKLLVISVDRGGLVPAPDCCSNSIFALVQDVSIWTWFDTIKILKTCILELNLKT
jgi:hypothetical protein